MILTWMALACVWAPAPGAWGGRWHSSWHSAQPPPAAPSTCQAQGSACHTPGMGQDSPCPSIPTCIPTGSPLLLRCPTWVQSEPYAFFSEDVSATSS